MAQAPADMAAPHWMDRMLKKLLGGAMGAGLVLVVLPSAALFFGMKDIHASPWSGLPILAVFGIMILFGALALVSTLFARLGLATPSEALALPPGSIRAAIALSLIVLFAIIAIMLYHSMAEPYVVSGLAKDERDTLLQQTGNRVLAVRRELCPPAPPASGTASAACPERYEVHLVQPRGQDSTDLAKQLLILVGTLMTSVTSYYFAARTAAPPAPESEGDSAAGEADDIPAPPTPAAADAAENNHDGCEVPIADATPDDELPPARGGVS